MACVQLNQCLADCAQGDMACLDKCEMDHADGVNDLNALYSCLICNPAACYVDCDGASICM